MVPTINKGKNIFNSNGGKMSAIKFGEVEIQPKHDEIKKTMIAKGFHSNYAEFESNNLKGCITSFGESLIIEIGDFHRWKIDLTSMIKNLLEEALNNQPKDKR